MKRTITIILITLILINLAPAMSFAASEPPNIIAETAIVIDVKTGQVLYDKNMKDQRYPASTTKMITALLALENLDLEKTVTIDAETPFTEGSRIYLLEGEHVTVEQLLYALMLESANDAAVALGKEIAGTAPAFAEMMNQKAIELGAENTNFVNPNGLHDDNHLSTAYDLAMIAREAMKNEKFRELVTTYRYVLPETNMQETRYFYNTNRLLYDEKTKVIVNGVQLGIFGAGQVLIMPAAPGTGVIAGSAVRMVLELAGLKDVRAKSIGSNNAGNMANATIEGLRSLMTVEQIGKLRGKTKEEILG